MEKLRRRSVLGGLLAAATIAALPPVARAAEADVQGLRAIADGKKLRVGSAIDPELLGDPAYVKLILEQCNTIVPRNAMKWAAVEPKPGTFTFGNVDKVVAFAQKNKLGMRGHTLVWYNSPGWVTRLKSPEAVRDAVVRHITTVMSRYAGRIASWDVVNEPFEYDSPELRKMVFSEQLGEQYMDLAFHTARAADPTGQLVLNETHLYEPGDVYDAKRKAVLALLDRLQARKVPIDALGVQGHIRPGLDKVDADAFGAFCREVKSRGLAMLLTELDASCRFIKRVPGFKPADYGIPMSQLISTAQANARLSAVIFWGLSPHGQKPNEVGKNAECRYRINLFDDELQPLPTFDAVQKALGAFRT
ncbi:MAG TPA: endo-1,4-beta-xylanase [Devosiaceae bacterium]|nr:endo-1,4-beta-xylanase [Devosiaceae bacterium]